MLSKDRTWKRASRRTRYDNRPATSSTIYPSSAPQKVSTRNKYLLLQEKDKKERDWELRRERVRDEEMKLERREPRPSWMPAAAADGARKHTLENINSTDRLRLRMTRVDGFNSAEGLTLPQRKMQNLRLAERACIPTNEVINVLEKMSSTIIFNTANKEERLALASRLRRWAVEDGTYLIREGDGDKNQSAIFMIASGKATVSLNRILEDGSVEEADIKNIRSPNYFGEGKVLGDSRAYASVRAKEELVVYYIMRQDVKELVSPATRALMVRDMEIRKFQKEKLDDLFGVIRENPSGMECLARFAKEQRMGGDVAFFTDVEEYKRIIRDDARRRGFAQNIVDTYISPSTGDPGLIYTSEAQRKAIVMKMRRLWGRPRREKEKQGHGSQSMPKDNDMDTLDDREVEIEPTMKNDNVAPLKARLKNDLDCNQHETEGANTVQASSRRYICDDAFIGEPTARNVNQEGGGFQVSDKGGSSVPPRRFLDGDKYVEWSERIASDDWDDWSGSDFYAIEEGVGAVQERKEADHALSLALFDEVLDQNAIPTIRQNIIPKFIQSSYYELFMTKLFPQVGITAADSRASKLPSISADGREEGIDENRGRALSDSVENLKHDCEAAEKAIAEAVAAAAAAAVAAAAAEDGCQITRKSLDQVAREDDPGPQNMSVEKKSKSHLDATETTAGSRRHPFNPAGEGGGSGDESVLPASSVVRSLNDDDFNDELLVVTNFRQERGAWGLSRRGFAVLQAVGDVCVVM